MHKRRVLRRFEQWLADAGARHPKLVVEEGAGGERWCRATGALAAGEAALVLPRACLITTEVARQHKVVREVVTAVSRGRAKVQSHEGNLWLACFLLADQHDPRSPYHAYHAVLPAQLRHIPLWWSEAELARLHQSRFVELVRARREAIAADWVELCRAVPALERLGDCDAFMRAEMLVCSRAFSVRIEGRRERAMVPFADLLNTTLEHEKDVDFEFDDGLDAFVMRAQHDVAAGSEVRDSYGAKCNRRFLLNYGFVIPDNADRNGACLNEVTLHAGLLPGDPLYAEKAGVWVCGADNQPAWIQVEVSQANGHAVTRLLPLLRVATAEEADFFALRERFLFTRGDIATRLRALVGVPAFSRINEAAAHVRLAELAEDAQAALGQQPDPVPNAGSPESSAALLLAGERAALARVARLGRETAALLASLNPTAAESRVAAADTEAARLKRIAPRTPAAVEAAELAAHLRARLALAT